LRKCVFQGGKGDGFFGAARRIRARIEIEDEFLPFEVGKRHRSAAVPWERKRRRPRAHRQGRSHTPSFRRFRSVILPPTVTRGATRVDRRNSVEDGHLTVAPRAHVSPRTS